MNHREQAIHIHTRAYMEDPMYTAVESQQIAQLAGDMIDHGSYSLVFEGVAHACYTPLVIDNRPDIKAYVLAPLAVLPEHQRQGVATRLMERAERELQADVIFVMGHPKHYQRRYGMTHQVATPMPSDKPEHWFAREMTPGVLDGVVSSSTIEGPYADPDMWFEPERYKAEG